MSSEPKQAGKGKRRWFQFRLGTLFVFVALLCCLLAWINYERQRASSSQSSRRALRGVARRTPVVISLRRDDGLREDAESQIFTAKRLHNKA